jgi:hypothetical protein
VYYVLKFESRYDLPQGDLLMTNLVHIAFQSLVQGFQMQEGEFLVGQCFELLLDVLDQVHESQFLHSVRKTRVHPYERLAHDVQQDLEVLRSLFLVLAQDGVDEGTDLQIHKGVLLEGDQTAESLQLLGLGLSVKTLGLE